MADRAASNGPASGSPQAGSNRGWLPALAVASCLAVELMVASGPLGSALGSVVQTTALGALAVSAVALSLRQALGGLSSRALRWAVVGPLVFSLVLVVVLALDAGVRARTLLR